MIDHENRSHASAALLLARREAYDTPLADINVSKPRYFQTDTIWPFFERLRREDPVHYCRASVNGAFWSVTKFKDIMQVEADHETFSSAGGIGISDPPPFLPSQGFIGMDPPKHDEQRKTVSPIVAPSNLVNFEKIIRSRVGKILDELPIDEDFNWVEKVSIALTQQMLATLFDFPWEDRHLLTFWSDAATSELKGGGVVTSEPMRQKVLGECLDYFTRLWNERVNAEPGSDLISMLAHSPSTRQMGPEELLGNLVLLIVGGNDTTRNSISGGLYFLNQNPVEFQKLRDQPTLIPNMVSEIIRYQTPLAHMRRTATRDTELGGKAIKKGEKVVMWYLSGNRDEDAIDRPDQFIIDRPRARQHLSFGFGIHRCIGNRLAELQLKIMWEEILRRFTHIEVVGEPQRIYSNFVHGYMSLPTRISAQARRS
jgi:cytochrome P450